MSDQLELSEKVNSTDPGSTRAGRSSEPESEPEPEPERESKQNADSDLVKPKSVTIKDNREDSQSYSLASSIEGDKRPHRAANGFGGEGKAKDIEAQSPRSSFNFNVVSPVEERYRVDWRNLKFDVNKKISRKEFETLNILKRISGVAQPGRFLAILGASGAGKSSFLNVLAGRLRSHDRNTVTGEILVNGETMDQRAFEKITAYVMQHDALLETLTPREAFLFAAKLRLPKSVPIEAKRAKVEQMLNALDLQKCADSYIGGNQIQGISGGERKRVSVGIELITNPSIILVDEPTSGLDSFTAYQTLELLVDLAQSGRTVAATIHQPNSEMFSMFDDLLLLSEGDIMYLGPANEAVEYFASIGHPCPHYTNPADFFIDMVHGRGDENIETRKMLAAECQKRLIDPIVKHQIELPKQAEEDSESGSGGSSTSKDKKATSNVRSKLVSSKDDLDNDKPTTFDQLKVLTWRSFVNFIRQPLTSRMRVGNQVFFAVLMGIIFFNLPQTARAVSGRIGAIFACMMNQAMSLLMSVVLTFPVERTMFERERANGMYSTFAYFASKVLVEFPFNVFYVFLFTVIVYPMVGFNPAFENAARFYLMMLTAAQLAYSLGILVGSAAPTPEAGVSAAPMFILPFILFSGFFVNTDDMQPWISWLSWVSWVKYLIEGLIVNEFSSDFLVSDCQSPNAVGCQFRNGDEILEFYGYQDVNYWEWWGVLMGFTTLYLALAYYFLRKKAKKKSREPLQSEQPEDV